MGNLRLQLGFLIGKSKTGKVKGAAWKVEFNLQAADLFVIRFQLPSFTFYLPPSAFCLPPSACLLLAIFGLF
jgi:hypothetical protein